MSGHAIDPWKLNTGDLQNLANDLQLVQDLFISILCGRGGPDGEGAAEKFREALGILYETRQTLEMALPEPEAQGRSVQ